MPGTAHFLWNSEWHPRHSVTLAGTASLCYLALPSLLRKGLNQMTLCPLWTPYSRILWPKTRKKRGHVVSQGSVTQCHVSPPHKHWPVMEGTGRGQRCTAPEPSAQVDTEGFLRAQRSSAGAGRADASPRCQGRCGAGSTPLTEDPVEVARWSRVSGGR